MAVWRKAKAAWLAAAMALAATSALATPFTTTVPGTGVQLPAEYPEAGGVAFVLTGVNGNIYYQFSDPDGAFRGFNSNGDPVRFRGNPFTINDPIPLNCGFRNCTDYFGGAIARLDIRFSAYDGDTQVGGFDQNDITLRINNFDVGSWSGLTTERTSNDGLTSFGFENGFGNNVFNTGWFSSTNQALLNNILSTNQTVAQVFDRDPDDNFWDFRRGPRLPDEDLRTVAPGYEFEKTLTGGPDPFVQVGDVLNYSYLVRNIGSVRISDITVTDDKIANVSCPAAPNNSLEPVPSGSTSANTMTCTGTYVVTQEDVDAGEVTNIARANGDPEFGQLGEVSDTVTVPGPALNSAVTLDKVGSPDPFGNAGSTVTYDFTITNTGNTTLTNVVVTDPMVPTLSCTIPTLLPLSADNSVNTATCSATYTVTQDDVDDFILSGTTLDNSATVNATGPEKSVSATAVDSLNGPAAAPALTIDKTALQASYATIGDTIDYRFVIQNTGNVTWPGPPVITDVITGGATCPTGPVAPNATITCEASLTITQAELDDEEVVNNATADITVGGVTASASDGVTVPADVTTGLTIEKRLQAGSPDPFDAVGQQLVYEYVITNTGNVTVENIAVDDDKVAVTCTPNTLAPTDAPLVCTSAAYTIDQNDLDAGSVTNIASAAGATLQGGTVESDDTSLTVSADQTPAMSLVKSAPTIDPVDFVEGLQVTYTYTVENTGNVTINDPLFVEDDKFVNPDGSFAPIACGTAPLTVTAPDNVRTCSAVYTVTAADVLNGFVTNQAVATDGTTRSNADSATVPQAGTPAVTIDKVATTTDFTAASDRVEFTFTVRNTGTVNIVRENGGTPVSPITIDDPQLTGFDPVCEQPLVLFPESSTQTPTSYTCTGFVDPVGQAAVDAGEYTNSATASFPYQDPTDNTAPVVTVSSAPSSATITSSIVPDFALTKSTTDTYGLDGDVISYTLTVENLTNQTLTSVTVTDPLVPGYSCTLTNVGPMATVACPDTVDYTVDQDDLDFGQVDNTATAVATAPDGTEVTRTADETVLFTPATDPTILSFTKTASPATFTAPGEDITYTLAVTNDGLVTLRNIVIDDPDLGLTCTIPSLAPGITDSSCQGMRTTIQDDVDQGGYTNNATADADAVDPVNGSSTITGPTRNADYVFTKTASNDFTAVGDRVTFTLSLQNTGNVTLTNIALLDTFFDPDLSCSVASLAPGATDTSCSRDYIVQQSDIDAGSITNMGSFTSDGVIGGPSLSDTATAVSTGPDRMPAIAVNKVERDGSGTFSLNVVENYDFTVTNTGNVTLRNVALTDALTGYTCTIGVMLPGDIVTSCPTGGVLETSVTPDQDDVDLGALENTVTVTGDPDGLPQVSSTSTVTLAGPDQLPALSTAKTVNTGNDFAAVGDIVTYFYDVTNTGNITLTAPITVADNLTTVTCPALPAGGLPIGQTLRCEASYAVDQDDLDRGFVTNIASASIDQPVVPNATYPDGTASVTSPDATATADADQMPDLSIEKRIKPGTASTYTNPNDPIIFEFIVTNSGNVTLLEDIFVTDTLIPTSNLFCGTGPIAPDATVTCEATWPADQLNIDDGSFTNSATASTTFGGTPVVTGTPGQATAFATQLPALETAKDFVRLIDGTTGATTTTFAPGNIAEYTFTVTNTGNTTIEDPLTVNDNLIGAIPCGTADLAPGSSRTCSGQYTITQGDFDLGVVTNIASATDGTTTSPTVSESIPGGVDPAIEMVKSVVTVNSAAAPNIEATTDTITYRYTITNTSPDTGIRPALGPIFTVTDDKFPGTLTCDSGSPLAPDASFFCEQTYPVSQDDLDAVATGLSGGFVTNTASAETTFASQPVTSNVDDVTVFADAKPALSVAKTAVNQTSPGEPANIEGGVGDTLEFTITVSNTGNQTMSNVIVDDPMLTGLSCTVNGASPANIVIAPGQDAICTGTYVVTQEDIDAGIVENLASAEAANPQGAITRETGDTTYPVETPAPALTVAKDLEGLAPTFTDVGQTLDFRITVTNSGNVTMNNISVTDSLVPGICTVGTLAPGDTDDSCVFTYAVTQNDIDTGVVNNTATATGTPNIPGGTPQSFTGNETVAGPAREPSFAVSKVGTGPLADGTFDAEGQIVSYVFTLVNTGNVSLTEAPTLIDDKIGTITDCDPISDTQPLLPSETLECRADYAVSQDEVDAGFVTNLVNVTMTNEYDPTGPPLTANTTETVDAVREPSMTVDKMADQDADITEGSDIVYTYTITNTGNVRLSNITLTDDHTSAAGTAELTIDPDNVIISLDPGASETRTATYTVTQADIDEGADLTNLLTVEATPPTGLDPFEETDDEVVSLAAKDAEMTVLKTVPSPPATLVDGTDVTFQITVANTGNVTLSVPNLADTLSTVNDLGKPDVMLTPALQSGNEVDPANFNVGETFTYTVTYTVTQDDVDAGGISNTVVATATDPQGETVTDTSDNGAGDGDDPTVVSVAPAGNIAVTKSVRTAAPDPAKPGDEVVFEIQVANTGNVTMTAPVLDENLTRADNVAITPDPTPVLDATSDTNGDGQLDLTETWIYTVTYALTQEDIDAGGLINTVTATADDPNGTESTGTSDPTPAMVNADPSIAVVKTVTSTLPTLPQPNDIISFLITVENTGNVTLDAPVLVDTLSPLGGTAVSPAPVPQLVASSDTDGDGKVDVDETWEYTLDYVITQDDIDAGGVQNSVAVTADDPSGTEVSDTSNNADTPGDNPTIAELNQLPGIAAVKTILGDPEVAGDTVLFEIQVRNTGNVTLTAVDIASDTLTRQDTPPTPLSLASGPDFLAADNGSPEGTLKAGETATYRASYVLLQEDIDAGGIANTATAIGTPPRGAPPITDVSDNGSGSGDDPTLLTIPPAPALEMTKRLIAGGPTYSVTTDVLTFAFDVTNTGNVTIPGTVEINDPLLTSLGGTVACPAGDILPDGMITCEGSFTVTQGQIDAGSLTNTATAVSDLATSPESSVTVLAQQNPAMETAKEAVSVAVDGQTFAGVPDEQFRVGAVITYNYTVTNTGNTTIVDAITVSDNLIDPVSCPALPTGGLAPNADLVCEATFEVTADDVALGSVTNLASATDGTTTSDQTSETVPAGGVPALTTQKELISAATADGTDIPSLAYSAVGDTLTYRYTVTNTGQTSFVSTISIMDDRIADPIVCFTSTADDPDLFQGESITCEAVYTVIQDDIDAGFVTNTAFAETIFGASNREVVSPPVMETATAVEEPGLELSKTAATLPVTTVDQVLTYTLRAENIGNQTLRQVSVTDPLLDGFTCEAATLAPGAVLTCQGDYTVDQDDVDRGSLLNTANATAIDPRGNAITDATQLTVDMPASAPAMSLYKTASVEPFGAAGSTIQYRFAVTNEGNTTLTNITVTDDIVTPPFTCEIPELAVGETNDLCVLSYTVTQDDVDRGDITNSASAIGQDPFGTDTTATDTINTVGQVAAPSLIATKRASVAGDGSAGSVITFTVDVINNGNVTLSGVELEDTMQALDGRTITLDAPFAFTGGDDNDNGRLNLSEEWSYRTTYTLTQADVDAGGVSNVVISRADDPTGEGFLDESDDGIDTDGNTTDDPTQVMLAAAPSMVITKAVGTTGSAAGDTVTFDITVQNTGNVTLDNFDLTDTMTNADGTDVSGGVVGPTRIADGGPIAPLETATFQVSYTLTQADVDSGGLLNSISGTATGPDGSEATDVSDSADPADGEGDADATSMTIVAAPSATLTKEAGEPVRLGGGIFDVPFTVTATNTGNVTLTGLTLQDDLAAFAAPATVVSVTTPEATGLTAGDANVGFNGTSDIDLLDAAATLAPAEVAVVTFTVRIDINDGAPAQPNTVTLGSDRLDDEIAGVAFIAPLVEPDLVVTKSVTPGRALVGATVAYTIAIENEGEFNETGLTIVDEMPAGLRFVPGSAEVNGSPTPEPVAVGRQLRWEGLDVASGASLSITLQARVVEGPGRLENIAYALGRDGEVISNIASAVLEVPPEAVFDCSDVIGRVFDDRNLNGYQDGIPEIDRSLITDQTYRGGKFTAPPVEPPSAEKGLPGVRLSTVDGTIITTDAYGRYSVPCAALPADIGSNFTLKLDPSSLPTGYAVTSENPRTMRVTPGTVTRMNFGAGLADVIDVSLTNAAFPNGQPSDALAAGVRQLVTQLSGAPSVLKLRYYTNGESRDLARARLDAVEALLRDAWPPGGRYSLVIERTIAEVQ